MEKIMEQRRSEWLGLLKKMVVNVYARESHYNTLCPQMRVEKDKLAMTRKGIVSQTKQIHGLIHQMDVVGREGGFGVSTLMGHNTPDDLTAVVILLMVASRLNSGVSTSMRGIDDLIHFSTDISSPEEALFVRNLFRADSPLFPYVSIGRGIAVDLSTATLLESAFNKILGLSSDAIEARCCAEAILSRSR